MTKTQIIRNVQVNIPFTMLWNQYLDKFLKENLNPEIGLDAESLDRFTRDEFKGISEKFHERNLTITFHAPFADLSVGSSDPKIRDVTKYRFEQLMDLIPMFRPKTVVCHAGYDWKRYGYNREKWMESSLEMWTWINGEIKKAGSRMMLENVHEHGPEDIHFLFQGLKNLNAGFCLDTGHQSAFSRTSLDGWLDVLGSHIRQIHIHDNHGQKDEHLALGKGNIDFRSFFKRLKDFRKDPPVITLEPHREEDLQPSLEYLLKIWPW